MAAKRRKKHKNKISERINSVCYIEQKSECGLRPLRAVGSIYEPEAAGAHRGLRPGGKGKAEAGIQFPLPSVLRHLSSEL